MSGPNITISEGECNRTISKSECNIPHSLPTFYATAPLPIVLRRMTITILLFLYDLDILYDPGPQPVTSLSVTPPQAFALPTPRAY